MTSDVVQCEYDPYSHAAMQDPRSIYRELRAAGHPVYLPKYDAWAMACFDDATRTSLKANVLDFTRGQSPGQVLLGEPVPVNFTTMNGAEHRAWRNVLASFYTSAAIAGEQPLLEEMARSTLAPLLAPGEMDVYEDYANGVMTRYTCHNLGIPDEHALWLRERIMDMLHRDPYQVGMIAPRNHEGAAQISSFLKDFVARIRANPELAVRQTKQLMEAEVDGARLSDDGLVDNIFSLLVVGSETTPLAVAGTVYYLDQHPEQKRAVLADPSLAEAAFRETLRFDQPTNMLCRYARVDFEMSGQQIKAGQRLLVLYASANRDERRFERADEYDLWRYAGDNAIERDISFGAGTHFCLGKHLALLAGTVMLRELLTAVDDYERIETGCQRQYSEFLAGFVKVPIRFKVKGEAA